MEGRQLFIGVDGGQSSTRTVLIEESGRVLSVARSGPCNHIHEPGGLERQYRELRAGYEGVFRAIGQEPGHLHGVYLGLSGSGHRETIESVYDAEAINISNDAVTAHMGALAGEPGVLVIAGTGSIGYGKNAAGDSAFAGGWGYLIGDEGSAYDIARRGIQSVFRAADRRGPQTQLSDLLLRHYQCGSLRELHQRLYREEIGRDQLAAGAAVVAQAAQAGDDQASLLLQQAGDELALLVISVLEQVTFDDAVRVSYAGGVFNAGALILDPMMNRIQRTQPQAALVPPQQPPMIGAALMALQSAGVNLSSSVISSIQHSLKNHI